MLLSKPTYIPLYYTFLFVNMCNPHELGVVSTCSYYWATLKAECWSHCEFSEHSSHSHATRFILTDYRRVRIKRSHSLLSASVSFSWCFPSSLFFFSKRRKCWTEDQHHMTFNMMNYPEICLKRILKSHVSIITSRHRDAQHSQHNASIYHI